MAAGFPVKADYASGDVLTAAQMNDLSATVNYLDPTAKGDLFPASSGTALTRLAVGANDTVLTADSTTATGLKWAAPAGGGGMTLLSTTTLSGASTTISSIDQTYVNLQIFVTGLTNATNDSYYLIRPNGVSGNTTFTGNLTTTWENQQNQYIPLNSNLALRTSAANFRTVTINNYASTTTNKSFFVHGGFTNSSSIEQGYFATGLIETTSAISSLLFVSSGGDFSTGTVLIYGVK